MVSELAELKIDQDSPQEAIELLRRQLQRGDRNVDPSVVAQAELTLIHAYVAAWKAAAQSSLVSEISSFILYLSQRPPCTASQPSLLALWQSSLGLL